MLNPLRLSSALMLLSAPFLTWMTVVSVVVYQGVIVFGAAAQSNLLMISSSQLGTNVSASAVSGATLSISLLLVGSIAMLKASKLGVPISIAGMAAYLLPTYQTFGSQTAGLEQTFISPGIGLLVAGTAVVMGSLSPLVKSGSPTSLLKSLRTRQGLTKLGVSLGIVGLALDVANHAALGQLPDFIGSTFSEQFLHLGLVAGVASIALVALRGGARNLQLTVSGAALLLLGVDATQSIWTGNLNTFLGHNLTETALHLSVYYGVALTIIGGLVSPSKQNHNA